MKTSNYMNSDTDLRDGSDLDAEYGLPIVGAALIDGEGKGEENIITWHAYMQNIPNKIKEEGKALMAEMQNGFPASKEYFANLYKDMKVILDPKNIADKAAKSFENMKESFGKLSEYVRNDMGADLYKRFNSFISSVCDSFSAFKEAAKEKMTPAFESANKAFHDLYNKVVGSKAVEQVATAADDMSKAVAESEAVEQVATAGDDMSKAVRKSSVYEQAVSVASGIAKSAQEFGDGVYKAVMNKDAKKEKGGRE